MAILLIANLGLMLYFFVFRNHHEQDKPHPVSDFVQKELGLNSDQVAKYQQLRDQHRQKVRPLIGEMRRMKDSLYILLQQPGANDSTAQAVAKRIGERQEEWEMLIFHHFQQVRAICDSDQLPKLDTMVHHMINKWPWMRKNKPADK